MFEHWRDKSWRSRAVALVTTALVVAVGLSFVGKSPTASAMSILRPAASVGSDGRRVHVTASVHNDQARSLTGQIRWFLAAPGTPRPWEESAFFSKTIPLKFQPHGTQTVEWDEEVSVPSGFYELSLWADKAGRNGFEPAAGRILGPGLVGIDSSGVSFLRHATPSGSSAIVGVRVVAGDAASPLPVRADVSVRNLTDAPVTTSLRWDLIPAGDSVSARWYTTPAARGGVSVPVTLGPGATTTVSIDDGVVIDPGRYLIHLQTDSDDVLATQPLTAGGLNPALVRTQLPTGVVALTGIDGPTTWHKDTDPGVQLTVENLSNQPQAGQVFVYLAPPGAARPFDQPLAATPIGYSLAPRQRLAVPVRGLAHAGPGTYDLTAYVHVWGLDHQLYLVDSARWTQPVTYLTDELLITNLVANLSGSGGGTDIAVDVLNNKLVPLTGRVTWYLAPAGDGHPWESTVYQPAAHRGACVAGGDVLGVGLRREDVGQARP